MPILLVCFMLLLLLSLGYLADLLSSLLLGILAHIYLLFKASRPLLLLRFCSFPAARPLVYFVGRQGLYTFVLRCYVPSGKHLGVAFVLRLLFILFMLFLFLCFTFLASPCRTLAVEYTWRLLGRYVRSEAPLSLFISLLVLFILFGTLSKLVGMLLHV